MSLPSHDKPSPLGLLITSPGSSKLGVDGFNDIWEVVGDSMLEKASACDKNGLMKHEINNALSLLKQFRAKYPFAENPESIASLTPNDILKIESGELGEFFHYLEVYLKPLGHLTIHGTTV